MASDLAMLRFERQNVRVSLRKAKNPDAITLAQAASILGLTTTRVSALRNRGLLVTLPGLPSYSRADVEAFKADPWLTGTEAAALLGISRARVSQLARRERIPSHPTPSGRRVFRRSQLTVVANARAARRVGLYSALGVDP